MDERRQAGSRWRETCVGIGPAQREAVGLATPVALHMTDAILPAPALCIQAPQAAEQRSVCEFCAFNFSRGRSN